MIAFRVILVACFLSTVAADVATVDVNTDINIVGSSDVPLQDVGEATLLSASNASKVVISDEIQDATVCKIEGECEGEEVEEVELINPFPEREEGPGDAFGDVQISDVQEQKHYFRANKLENEEPLDPQVILNFVEETGIYMSEVVGKEEAYSAKVRELCQNYDPMCSVWALNGDCSLPSEESYMNEYCAPACKSCDKINPETHFMNQHDFDVEHEEEDEDEAAVEDEVGMEDEDAKQDEVAIQPESIAV